MVDTPITEMGIAGIAVGAAMVSGCGHVTLIISCDFITRRG